MRIAFPHPPDNEGGPGSFQLRLMRYLKKQGHEITYPKDGLKPDVIVVVGGTRKLAWLLWNKLRGVKIIHRLDGILWRHRTEEKISVKNFFLAVVRNQLMAIIRRYLSDFIIYQSQFVKDCWQSRFGQVDKECTTIVNGACYDFHVLRENPVAYSDGEKIEIVIVEGMVNSDKVTNGMLKEMAQSVGGAIGKVHVYGRLNSGKYYQHENIIYHGILEREQIHKIYEQFNCIFVPLEINPPCPNAVVEAISAGIPVVGFDTGSLKELVQNAGIVVQYEGNPWQLEDPDYKKIAQALTEVSQNFSEFRLNAYKLGEVYRLETMCTKYMSIIEAC